MGLPANTMLQQQDSPFKDGAVAQLVAEKLQEHLDSLPDGEEPRFIDRLVLDVVQPAVLNVMMRHTHSNQSKAAGMMDINRATLRVRLDRHGLRNEK